MIQRGAFPRNAFTLIEMLVVVVILSVVVALNLPNLRYFYQGAVLKQTAYRVLYLMQNAQTRALSVGRDIHLTFDEQKVIFQLNQESEKEGEFAPVPGRLGEGLDVPPMLHVKEEGAPFVFSRDGSISRGLIIICNHKKCCCLSSREERNNIKMFEFSTETE